MPYHYLEDIAFADVAFKATGKTIEQMFMAAADATMNVMVEDLQAILSSEQRVISLKEESLEMLLFHFLQEFIYYKDAQELLLRLKNVEISQKDDFYVFSGTAYGETLNADKHKLNTDVKAVTLHRLKVVETQEGWEATVVLDV